MTDPTSGRLSAALDSPDANQTAGLTAFFAILWISGGLGLLAHLSDQGLTREVAVAALALAGLVVWVHAIFRAQNWKVNHSPLATVLAMLSGVYLVLIGLLFLDSAYLVLLFGAYTISFAFAANFRWAALLSFVVTLIWVGAWLYHQLPTGALATPVLVWGTLLVIVAVGDRVERQSVERKELLEEIAATRSKLAETERQRGVLAERERVAADIHDTLAQGFTSIVLHSHVTAAQVESLAPGELADRIRLIEKTARENLDSARRMVEDLSPAELEKSTLAEAIRRTGEKFTEQTSVPVELQLEGVQRPVSGSIEIALLRVAQEALHNVAKHAAAKNVLLSLRYLDTALVLTVEDDGRGFRRDQAPSEVAGAVGGRGLGLLRNRVESAGGVLDLESTVGVGTVVNVEIPIPVMKEEAAG